MKTDRRAQQAAGARAYRERQKEKGMKKAQVWVHADDIDYILDLARELNEKRGL